MERRVLISPVGLEYERILYGLTIFPSQVLYLIRDDQPGTNTPQDSGYYQLYEATENFAKLIRKNAEQLKFEVQDIIDGVRLNSIETCVNALKGIIKPEIKENNTTEILINVSTATKDFALASYLIAAFFQQTISIKLFYLRANNYTILDLFMATDLEEIQKKYREKGTTYGPYDLEEIPVIPFFTISEEMQNALQVLCKEKNFSSLFGFLEKIVPDLGGMSINQQKAFRMKYNSILQRLEQIGLVKINRRGRNVEMSITKTGELLNLVIS